MTLPLADSETIHLKDGQLSLYPQFLYPAEAKTLFTSLNNYVPWQQDQLIIAGKQIPVPRLQAWYADAGLSYSYSGLSLKANGWSDTLLALKATVEMLTGATFNSALVNLYRNGRDSVDWHADNEPELGQNPVIASLSLGCTRTFQLKRRDKTPDSRRELPLADGSLLVMTGAIQHHWLHRIPKEPGIAEPRINITFRQLITL